MSLRLGGSLFEAGFRIGYVQACRFRELRTVGVGEEAAHLDAAIGVVPLYQDGIDRWKAERAE